MASSSEKRKYPSRLYEEGKSPLQNRSINHNCFRAKFAIIKDGLGDDVWSDLRDSSVGVFIKFAVE
ncbi:unnamed protein product [Arabis nemorensis]|uniref:Uncharacterized protein n=1 Tax=Arabis nemorensis TaxID=586526 RepID=A0A565B8W1_9BRAS|nr:unnamed protein product [Arabis nemorensis]